MDKNVKTEEKASLIEQNAKNQNEALLKIFNYFKKKQVKN